MLIFLKNIFKKIALNRIVQHILFWALSFLVLVNILKVSAEIYKIDTVYTAIFHLPIVLVTYLNLSVLVPRFLEKERYLYYGVSVVALISVGAVFYLLLFERWIDYILQEYFFIAYYNFWDISLYFAVYLLLTTLIRLARSWFRLNQAEREKTSSELKALRSQINPHFLFNSLNSIYSLSRRKSDLAPEAIVKLSDVLRYVIYDAETSKIDLKDEIGFLQKYINLQQLRMEENLKLEVVTEGELNNQKIAPLLFLPFVENAFKYAPQSENEDKFITIRWKIEGPEINFEVVNSYGELAVNENEKYKGIGIKNVIKRLEILYPDKHKLEISLKEGEYQVDLNIQLS